jgi:hypothetical protein
LLEIEQINDLLGRAANLNYRTLFTIKNMEAVQRTASMVNAQYA